MKRNELNRFMRNQDIRIPKQVGLVLLVMANVIMFAVAVLAFTSDKDVYQMLLIGFGPILILMTAMTIIEEIMIAHRVRNREVKPLSYYDSIQHRALKFLNLKIPAKNKSLKNSIVNKCIETYAKNGHINLTEKERTELSFEILETGISSQEPGEKSYYERERVAIIENILSEKYD